MSAYSFSIRSKNFAASPGSNAAAAEGVFAAALAMPISTPYEGSTSPSARNNRVNSSRASASPSGLLAPRDQERPGGKDRGLKQTAALDGIAGALEIDLDQIENARAALARPPPGQREQLAGVPVACNTPCVR